MSGFPQKLTAVFWKAPGLEHCKWHRLVCPPQLIHPEKLGCYPLGKSCQVPRPDWERIEVL